MFRTHAIFVTAIGLSAAPVIAQNAPATQPAKPKLAASRPGQPETAKPGSFVADKKLPDQPPQMPPAVNPVSGKGWSCPGTVYDFGQVWQNANVTYNFEIKNTGDKDLEIVDAKTECHCTVPGQFDRIIKPGQTGHVPFTLHTSGLGKFLVKHCFITLSDQQSLSCELHGFVKTLFELSPNDLGNYAEITNPMSEIVREGDVKSNIPEPFTFELMPVNDKRPFKCELKEVEPGKKWHITLRTVPPLPAGNMTYFYTFKTSNPNLPMWNLVVSAYRPERISAKPPNVYMPNVVTSAAPFSVEVMNYTGKPYKVLSAEIKDAPELTTEIVPNGTNYKVLVHAPMGYRVPQSRHLIIKTDDETLPPIDVTLYTIIEKPNLPPIQRNQAGAAGPQGAKANKPGGSGKQGKGRGGRMKIPPRPGAATQPAGEKIPNSTTSQ